jgi:hypothetical protein
VVDRDELEPERTQCEPVTGSDLVVDGLLEAVLAQLGAEQAQGQLRADQGDVAALTQEVRRGADVVLVAMGQDQRLDLVEAVADRIEVGQDQVDPGVDSSGNSTPQSTISRRPSYSKTVMLRPTSPRPPSG